MLVQRPGDGLKDHISPALRDRLNRTRESRHSMLFNGSLRREIATALGIQLELDEPFNDSTTDFLWELVRLIEPLVENDANSIDPGGGPAVRAAVESLSETQLVALLVRAKLGEVRLNREVTVRAVRGQLRQLAISELTVRLNRLLNEWRTGSQRPRRRSEDSRRDRQRSLGSPILRGDR